MEQANRKPVRVDVLALPETAASGLYGFVDLLSSVGIAWESTVSHAPVVPRFSVRIVAADATPFRCVSGAMVTPAAAIDAGPPGDIVLIPAVQAPSVGHWRLPDRSVYEWLAGLDQSRTRLVSACTGALVLAESGVLNGHEATTHWAYRDVFRQYYPKIRLRIERNLCASGQCGTLITSGGASAWQTLALYLITEYCGRESAIQTSKFWLLANAGELQSPYASMLIRRQHGDPVVEHCEKWIGAHFSTSNPVDSMIEQSGLPPTTFSRRFKRATGYAPIEYAQSVRIEEAKRMLESERYTVEEVSRTVGYEDLASFRRLFKRKVGVTPSEYRRHLGVERFGARRPA